MEERLEFLYEMLEGFENIKIDEKEIKRYKVNEEGVIVEFLTKEESIAQKKRIEIIKNNFK